MYQEIVDYKQDKEKEKMLMDRGNFFARGRRGSFEKQEEKKEKKQEDKSRIHPLKKRI